MSKDEQSSEIVEVLTSEERKRFSKCEAVVEKDMKAFLAVGRALAEIQQDQLYREDFKTFEKYVKSRWSLSRAHAYRLIEGAESYDGAMSPIGDNGPPVLEPRSESQIRPLKQLRSKELKGEAWRQAVVLAEGLHPTAKQVAKAVEMLQPENRNPERFYLQEMAPDAIESIDGMLKQISKLSGEIKRLKAEQRIDYWVALRITAPLNRLRKELKEAKKPNVFQRHDKVEESA